VYQNVSKVKTALIHCFMFAQLHVGCMHLTCGPYIQRLRFQVTTA